MLYLSLLCFALLGFLLICIIKNRWIRFVIAFLFECLFFLEFMAIFTKKSHVDYPFIANIDMGAIKMMFIAFLKQTVIFIIFIILFNYIGIRLLNYYDKKLKQIKTKYIIGILILIFGFNITKFGVINSFYKLSTQIFNFSGESSIEQNLKVLGINPKDYILKDDIVAEPGKNIVIIYLESLEKNFLDNEIFDDITPNLNRLREEWNFYTYQDDSGWTMGGIFTSQTGMLPLFGLNGNEIFQNITETKFPSIGAILEKAGYNQVYINGADLEYAGKGNFLELQGYECFGDNELDKSYFREGWGVKDKELFEEAKKKYLELSEKKQPFNLTLLTVDTHFPSGYLDNRLENVLKNKEKNLEYCVEQTDYLLNDFINFIKEQSNYENTVVYVFPDHRMMGNEITVPIVKKLNKKPRDLFFLSNQKNIFNYEDNDKLLYFYDIPRIILNGANVKTNAKFLFELIPNINVEKIYKKSKILQNLNLSLVCFTSLKDGIQIERLKNGKVKVLSKDRRIDVFKIDNHTVRYYALDETLNIKGMFNISKGSKAKHRHELDYTNSKNILKFELNESNQLEMFLLNYNDDIYYKQNYEMGKIKFSLGKYNVTEKGINLSKKEIKKILKRYNLIAQLKEIEYFNDYLKYIQKIKDDNMLIIFSGQDEVSNLYPLYKTKLQMIGSKLDLTNKFRWSYIAILDGKGKNYLEKAADKRLNESIYLYDNDIQLMSAGYNVGSECSIFINGKEYAKERRGMNVVLLDKKNGYILDSFSVDTYDDDTLKINR